MNTQLKLVFINLKKSKLTTILNLTGLVSAFAAFILIMLYVWHEYQYDTYNEHFSGIYRVEVKLPAQEKTSVYLMGPTGETITNEFPEIETSTIYMPWGSWEEGFFQWETERGKADGLEVYAYGDENLSDIFTFNFLEGEGPDALSQPGTGIISQSFAQKAWGKTNVTGKQLKHGDEYFTVTGVYEDLPQNSVVQASIILRLRESSHHIQRAQTWSIVNYPTFIRVKPGADAEGLQHKINQQSASIEKYNKFLNEGESVQLVLRPLGELHFTTGVAETPLFSSNNKTFVDALFLVGILIVIVALINYINLSTASIPQRIKSVSIFRILGGSRFNVSKSFILESLIIFGSSFLLATLLAFYLIHEFSPTLLGFRLPFMQNPWLFGALGLSIVLFAVAAGAYHSWQITTHKPIISLKRFNGRQKGTLRAVLTVTQFAATIALIIASAGVIKQVKFMEDSYLGYNKDNTLVVRINQDLRDKYNHFEERLLESPNIKEVAFSRAVPGYAKEMNSFVVDGQRCQVWYWAVDESYIPMMDFQLKEGRFFRAGEGDLNNIICNEAAAKKYGWTLGTEVNNGVLVGILKDFNYVSLRENVEPFVFWYNDNPRYFGNVSVKFSATNVKEALSDVRTVYRELSPELPFRYFFLGEHMEALYRNESRQAGFIIAFSFLSIIVSILGIVGLSIFISLYKTKEIGVRKVNGATITEVMTMLNRDFLKWVFIAFVIAAPLGWLAVNRWLENFAYRTTLSWWIFALSGILALVMALLAVSWQSWKAATRNPAEVLRDE
jgi:putative ABC transport system permease protein